MPNALFDRNVKDVLPALAGMQTLPTEHAGVQGYPSQIRHMGITVLREARHIEQRRRERSTRKPTEHEAAFQTIATNLEAWNRRSGRAKFSKAVNALLAAAKNKLQACRIEGDCSSLMPDEYCSDECVALAEAVKRLEGAE